MTWNERAEYVLGEIQYALDNPGHINADIAAYVRDSAHRIAFLEKALEQARSVANLTVAASEDLSTGVILSRGIIVRMTTEYPELAAYLRERADKETT